MSSFNEIADAGFSSLRACEGLSTTEIPASDEVDKNWCLRLLRAIRDTAFATIGEDGLPSVRIIDVMGTDGERLYFFTPRGKAFHEEVMRERFVAIVGQTLDYRTCRLRGHVKRIPDELQHAYVDALFAINPGMEVIYPDDKRYICDGSASRMARASTSIWDRSPSSGDRSSWVRGLLGRVACS